jgi:GNAT superfamily N-acetyltransferase
MQDVKAQLKVEYQVEPILTAWPDIQPLLPLHWEEIALDKEHIKLCVDEDYYQKREQDRSLVVITVRDPNVTSWACDPGKLAGYYIGFVTNHPHYKNDLFGLADIYFILKEYRKGRIGINLFKFAEQVMRDRGVKKMIASTKLHQDHGKIFEQLGWTEIERTYSKYIGD